MHLEDEQYPVYLYRGSFVTKEKGFASNKVLEDTLEKQMHLKII